MDSHTENRRFLRNDGWSQWDIMVPDQKKGVPQPPMQNPLPAGAQLIDLEPVESLNRHDLSLFDAITQRRSFRDYTGQPLTLADLSFLLWATQGLHKIAADGSHTLRSVPSAGACHPLETNLIVKQVTGLEPGLYRYQVLDHKLYFACPMAELTARAIDDSWLLPGEAVLFVWTVVPYRTEWRYDFLSHKMIAFDAGHVCQNLYLASLAVGAGTCAIGSFPQDEIDGILGVDGQHEFSIYMATVGKIGEL